MKKFTSGLKKTFFFALVLVAVSPVQRAIAKPNRLRLTGRTLIEAEDHSAASEKYPFNESGRDCSGEKTLSNFWRHSWFELQVDVRRMCNLGITLRASSPDGTKIDVQMVDASGKTKSLTTIDAPKTGAYADYTNTQQETLFLPSGTHTLRFKNLQDGGANIDYVTFSVDDVPFVAQPAATDGPDINPLKGFNSGWWRNEEYASVGFQYIEWGKFEPEDDKFDWDYVEEVLHREGTRGRHFILQFVVDWDGSEPLEANYRGPNWLLEQVGEHRGTEDTDDPSSRPMRATRYNDARFIEEATEAIKTLIDRYKHDERTFVIQVGVLGFWAEWHTFPRLDWSPSDDTKKKILDAYLSNLGQDGLTQIRYPNEAVAPPHRGMGYTNGSVVPTDHGREFGQVIAARELWKNGPVGGEWPPNVPNQFWERFFLTDEGFNFINEARYSTILPPEPKEIAEKLPNWTPEGRFMTMHRQLGYNFRVNEVRHIVDGDKAGLHIEVDLKNAGIAPFYKDWDLQLGVVDVDTASVVETIEVDIDLRTLGPEELQTLSVSTAKELDPQRNYQIALRILQPGADEEKTTAWKLNARNVYVLLANRLPIIDGVWDKETNALRGGWNILGDVHLNPPKSTPDMESAFPFEGSFRSIE